jgi:hypothetical protein
MIRICFLLACLLDTYVSLVLSPFFAIGLYSVLTFILDLRQDPHGQDHHLGGREL